MVLYISCLRLGSLCSFGCPGTHYVDEVGFELSDPPASAYQVLGLKVCAIMSGYRSFLYVETEIAT